MVADGPVMIGPDGDIDDVAGKSGAVSALSWYTRLLEMDREKVDLVRNYYRTSGDINSLLRQVDPSVRINADKDEKQKSSCDCRDHHQRESKEPARTETA